jgi:hypothetical protein
MWAMSGFAALFLQTVALRFRVFHVCRQVADLDVDELMKGDFLDQSGSDDEELSEEEAAVGEEDDLDEVSPV